MSKEKPGVMMYWEMFDALDTLADHQAKSMLQAIRDYSRHGVVPDFGVEHVLRPLWSLVKYKIDLDNQRYERIIEKRREAGNNSAEKRRNKC